MASGADMDLPCVLCCSKEKDQLIFGKVYNQDQVVVHHNCLYLTTYLIQNGNEHNGILLFLKKDILTEVRRCSELRCFYCQRSGANIDCCHGKCRRSFHTKCGFDNLAVSQFSGTYKSFCHQHVPKYRSRPGPEELCMICFESLVAKGKRFSVATEVQSPCCKNGWYHRQCLQKYANSAGFTFKCPLCNNEKKFGEVALFGISISKGDASWELEPNAFADQLERDQYCTSTSCRRIGDGDDLIYCIMCGSNPMHTQCTSERRSTYRCADCIVVESSVATGSTADSISPVASPESGRLSQPISPRATAAQFNTLARGSRRRRTWAHSNARDATPERINRDESCVASRTRARLSTYNANQK